MALSPLELELTTENLLERIAVKRDQTAFAALFERLSAKLKTFAIRQGANNAEAEEIVQESMLAIWNKASHFNAAVASANTWIYTIVRNKRIDYLRKNKLDLVFSDDIWPDEQTEGPEIALLTDLNSEKIRKLFYQLPDEQRQVLYKSYFEDKSHGTIASELDLPLGTVKSRIRLAMNRLEMAVQDDKND